MRWADFRPPPPRRIPAGMEDRPAEGVGDRVSRAGSPVRDMVFIYVMGFMRRMRAHEAEVER